MFFLTCESLTLLKMKTMFFFQFIAAMRKIKYIVWILANFRQPLFCRLFKVGAPFSLLPLEARAIILKSAKVFYELLKR